MNTSAARFDSHATAVAFEKTALLVTLADGRQISAPLSWFPRLLQATDQQRQHWRLIGNGVGIHWPDLDEDVSVNALLKTKME